MKLKNYLFSSESVSEGHPDNVSYQTADGILDEYLKRDPMARVACEVLIANVYLGAMLGFKHLLSIFT